MQHLPVPAVSEQPVTLTLTSLQGQTDVQKARRADVTASSDPRNPCSSPTGLSAVKVRGVSVLLVLSGVLQPRTLVID